MKKNKIKSAQKSIAFCALFMSAILFLIVPCSFCKNKTTDNELAYESDKYTSSIATVYSDTNKEECKTNTNRSKNCTIDNYINDEIFDASDSFGQILNKENKKVFDININQSNIETIDHDSGIVYNDTIDASEKVFNSVSDSFGQILNKENKKEEVFSFDIADPSYGVQKGNKNDFELVSNDTEREIMETVGTEQSFSGLYLTSSFSTDISSSSENRKHNIYLAARAVDNTLLFPNSYISFNEIVGERSVKRGYKTSKVIEKNRYVEGVGGGVCQVSTTLYVAALMSNLQVVECHSHSIPSSYVSYSMDSTVAYDYLDLKIYNPSNAVYAIKTSADNDRLTINIYSTEKPKYKIILKSEVIEKIDPENEIELKTLPDGIEPTFDEEGVFTFTAKRIGIKSRLVAKYYDENGFAFSKVLRKDYYKEQPRVIYKQKIAE